MGQLPQPGRKQRLAPSARGQPCQRAARGGAQWPRHPRAASAQCAQRVGRQPAQSPQPQQA
eukprot:5790266-Alexandrium_andersonii.AAC.1